MIFILEVFSGLGCPVNPDPDSQNRMILLLETFSRGIDTLLKVFSKPYAVELTAQGKNLEGVSFGS